METDSWVNHKQVSRQVHAWLEEEISSGRLPPGSPINEKEICARFNVSRTPVREALLQLSTLGLITVRPRLGASVARMSVKQICAMWEVLSGLEAMCAGLAADRMSMEQRDRLRQIHESGRAHVESLNVEGYENLNVEFHELIYVGTQNDYLAESVRDLRKRLQPYRKLPFERPGGIRRSFVGHEGVVEAILAGDSATASAEMKNHVTGGLTFLDFIANLNTELEH
jgi:DNA-binding GntR family transcriptional regulator